MEALDSNERCDSTSKRSEASVHGSDVDSIPFSLLGLFYLNLDERNVPALGRIGDPDDTLATVLVGDVKVRWLDCCGLTLF